LDSEERKVLNSKPFQRLRCIHQLAMTYLLYPGATHRRFEHSLGVMELADRVFSVVTDPLNLTDCVRDLFPGSSDRDQQRYWRRVLRLAALCHDLGHLPFSHAAEKDLLPAGRTHEDITRELISSSVMRKIWAEMVPAVNPEHIIKLALGPKKAPDLKFSDWETILAEIIVGDAFGVDRIDYLLRDSHHTGVAYGKFDHYRLIETLRILPPPTSGHEKDRSVEPAIGVESGGLQSAEALLLARYFMFSQVYFHHIRRIYDIHLKDFLQKWLPNGKFPEAIDAFLATSDVEVTCALRRACLDKDFPGHRDADRIIHRKHFKLLYEAIPSDVSKYTGIAVAEAIARAAKDEFGPEHIRYDAYVPKGRIADFPVEERDKQIVSSLAKSQVLQRLPAATFEYVFVEPDIFAKAEKWRDTNKHRILEQAKGEEQ
jgi:HD superfamily phosphohydrolase